MYGFRHYYRHRPFDGVFYADRGGDYYDAVTKTDEPYNLAGGILMALTAACGVAAGILSLLSSPLLSIIVGGVAGLLLFSSIICFCVAAYKRNIEITERKKEWEDKYWDYAKNEQNIKANAYKNQNNNPSKTNAEANSPANENANNTQINSNNPQQPSQNEVNNSQPSTNEVNGQQSNNDSSNGIKYSLSTNNNTIVNNNKPF